MKTVFVWVQWVALFVIFAVSLFLIFYFLDIGLQGNANVVTDGVSAFAGAFFALFFTKFGEYISGVSQRITKHHTAMVKTEGYLQQLLGEIHDNIYVADGIIKTISSGKVSWNRITRLTHRDDITIELADLDVINNLVLVLYDVRRLNDDSESFNYGEGALVNALLSQGDDFYPRYIENQPSMVTNLCAMSVALSQLETRVIKLLAIIRIGMKKDTPWHLRLKVFLIKTSSTKIKEEEIVDEEKIITTELTNSSLKSQKDIAEMKEEVSKKVQGLTS